MASDDKPGIDGYFYQMSHGRKFPLPFSVIAKILQDHDPDIMYQPGFRYKDPPPQPDPAPVDPRTVDDSVQALREGHDPDTLREIARRLLGRDEPVEDNPAFLLRVTPDASTSLGLSARVLFGPTAEQAIGRLGVGVYALYPERPTRAQPNAEPVEGGFTEALIAVWSDDPDLQVGVPYRRMASQAVEVFRARVQPRRVSRAVRDRIAKEIEAADEAGDSYRHLADDILMEILGLQIEGVGDDE